MDCVKAFFKEHSKWILLIGLVTILMIVFIYVLTGNIQPFDNGIYSQIEPLRNPQFTNLLIGITNLGGTFSLFLITFVSVIILFLFKKRKLAIGVTLNLLISSLTYVILKNVIQRPRPPIDERLIEETGFSFPSGHTTNNTAFYAFAIYLICKHVKNKWIRNSLCIFLSLLILVIGFSRIYLRVHYPSDVLAGLCLGILLVIIFVNTIYKNVAEK